MRDLLVSLFSNQESKVVTLKKKESETFGDFLKRILPLEAILTTLFQGNLKAKNLLELKGFTREYMLLKIKNLVSQNLSSLFEVPTKTVAMGAIQNVVSSFTNLLGTDGPLNMLLKQYYNPSLINAQSSQVKDANIIIFKHLNSALSGNEKSLVSDMNKAQLRMIVSNNFDRLLNIFQIYQNQPWKPIVQPVALFILSAMIRDAIAKNQALSDKYKEKLRAFEREKFRDLILITNVNYLSFDTIQAQMVKSILTLWADFQKTLASQQKTAYTEAQVNQYFKDSLNDLQSLIQSDKLQQMDDKVCATATSNQLVRQ